MDIILQMMENLVGSESCRLVHLKICMISLESLLCSQLYITFQNAGHLFTFFLFIKPNIILGLVIHFLWCATKSHGQHWHLVTSPRWRATCWEGPGPQARCALVTEPGHHACVSDAGPVLEAQGFHMRPEHIGFFANTSLAHTRDCMYVPVPQKGVGNHPHELQRSVSVLQRERALRRELSTSLRRSHCATIFPPRGKCSLHVVKMLPCVHFMKVFLGLFCLSFIQNPVGLIYWIIRWWPQWISDLKWL